MSDKPVLVWFPLGLRISDHPALRKAVAMRRPVIPVFIWAPEEESPWRPGAASQWWLHQSLKQLQQKLKSVGSKLVLRHGPTAEALMALAKESGADTVLWNHRYEPASVSREQTVERRLRHAGLATESFSGDVLFEPGSILNSSSKPFQVFTAFWRAAVAAEPPAKPTPAPRRLAHPAKWPKSLDLNELGLEPEIDWAEGLRDTWTPGEQGATKRLKAFLRSAVDDYAKGRNEPDHVGTSRLSPHLHFGEISPRQVWAEGQALAKTASAEVYLRQISWREFSTHLLFHFPHTQKDPLRAEFRSFPWQFDGKGFKAWTKGMTGYPMVDAGMRELWRTGWMHNRVRMLVASFLVKHLMIAWQEGAAWFWDTLVDADLGNNTMGWQWSAGCGADAAPYFRIFSPVLQGKKFDAEGEYVRQWVPELAKLPNKWIHRPWEAPEAVLLKAEVELGKTYPAPIVEHKAARKRALQGLAKMRKSKS